jgi:hypothetical protein
MSFGWPLDAHLTRREQRMLLYGGLLVYSWGFAPNNQLRSIARYVSLGALAVEGFGHLQEQKLFAAPETMNAFFKTDGAVSATRGGAQVRAAAQVMREK